MVDKNERQGRREVDVRKHEKDHVRKETRNKIPESNMKYKKVGLTRERLQEKVSYNGRNR